MKTVAQSSSLKRWSLAALCVLMGLVFFMNEADAQRRGGSFGGFRRSSPSYAPSRPAAPSSSFGGSRSTTSPAPSAMQRSGGSFGGSRAMAPAAANYQRSYGIPRQSTPMNVPGVSSPYMVHNYGGYTDGLMMGYLMGRTSAMWYTPFHPAFYYSRPVYVPGANGAMEVYPPTFSFLKLFLGLAIFGVIIWLVMRFLRRRSSGADDSQSSFA
jgi:hypothetical protein